MSENKNSILSKWFFILQKLSSNLSAFYSVPVESNYVIFGLNVSLRFTKNVLITASITQMITT